MSRKINLKQHRIDWMKNFSQGAYSSLNDVTMVQYKWYGMYQYVFLKRSKHSVHYDMVGMSICTSVCVRARINANVYMSVCVCMCLLVPGTGYMLSEQIEKNWPKSRKSKRRKEKGKCTTTTMITTTKTTKRKKRKKKANRNPSLIVNIYALKNLPRYFRC